jgi:hypothetical protein
MAVVGGCNLPLATLTSPGFFTCGASSAASTQRVVVKLEHRIFNFSSRWITEYSSSFVLDKC